MQLVWRSIILYQLILSKDKLQVEEAYIITSN